MECRPEDMAFILKSHNAFPALLDAAQRGLALAEAVIAYDEAIRSCANDPDRMTSFCTAGGNDLDAMYEQWLSIALEAMGRQKELMNSRDTP